MDKIILYGVGMTFRSYEKNFSDFQRENKIEIIGVADRSLTDKTYNGFKVLRLNEIPDTDADFVIITAAYPASESICADLMKAGVAKEKIVNILDYELIVEMLDKSAKERLPVQLDVIRTILQASDGEVESFDWMRGIVKRYGVYPWRSEYLNEVENGVYTRAGILQEPNEFTRYLVYLSKFNIDKAIELGVFRGKSSYFMCAMLARKNPRLVYELVDVADNLDNFEEFNKLLPQLRKHIPSTSADHIGKEYDFVFIDADHSYDASMKDYMNLGRHAKKLTVFHDIYGHEYDRLNGGTVRTWQEVVNMTKEHKHHIFSSYPNKIMGIGVVERYALKG